VTDSARPRFRTAAQAASSVIRDYDVRSLPVDIEVIARSKVDGLETMELPSRCFGALARRGNEIMILVSPQCPNDGHRRFTIAHEIGHLVIDGHFDAVMPAGRDFTKSDSEWSRRKPWYEIEADMFASDLLLPPNIAAKAIDFRVSPSIPQIANLADAGNTSLIAAAIKYATLSDEAVAVLVSHDRTVQWATMSSRLEEHAWANRWAAKGEWAPRGSATNRLAANVDKIRNAENDKSYGSACEWFRDAPDIELDEEARGLGKYGRVLTLLHFPDLPAVDDLDGDQW
jgi:Zn-dependent peptidase ImmA (M78 family)